MLYHPDDEKWLKEQFKKLPERHRVAAIKGYDRVFREVFDATPLVHQKDGEARREANTRLRRYIDAVTKNPRTQAGAKEQHDKQFQYRS